MVPCLHTHPDTVHPSRHRWFDGKYNAVVTVTSLMLAGYVQKEEWRR